ncbi:hypothetical protein B0T18DRAFT_386301 [Schizothecium vesticola]|uniref:FAD-binding PCMH-type domain-containing protein n=1 Tax=Schizothecium vesticola TaxID=314040 RepID=A0AA40FAU6_9PEZI|nr:hypothetical protein B0T18DRAFT_386301 [Schizothecium vesticola]
MRVRHNSPALPLLHVLALLRIAAADTCTTIAVNTTIEVATPLALTYVTEQQDYWSTSCAALRPSCIIFPRTAAEVSTVLSVLHANNEPFAVKSGGHNPNNLWSSVAGGPVLSTQRMDGVSVEPATGVITIGPGNRLDEVAAKLQGSGWTFVGGRIGHTGVGGLVVGGGLSYLSAQYGWAASCVLAFDVVLANGTVTRALATENPDLFVALKGGGNNFGVVTAYVVQGYQQDLVLGGNLVFARSSAETSRRILKAVRDFTEHNADNRAAVIVTAERTNLDLVDSWILFLFYDGPEAPPGTFDNFTSIGPTLNTVRTRTYADLLAFSNWVIVPGSVVTIGTETVPLPSAANAEEVMEGIHAHWRNVSGSVLDVPGLVASIAYQPFPRQIARAARAKGPDLIDADDDADRLIIEMNYSFVPQSEYGRMADTMEATYTGVRELVAGWQAEGVLQSNLYLPILMSYGFFRQDYFARLKPESAELAREVASRVDPDGMFRDRTGGWKP